MADYQQATDLQCNGHVYIFMQRDQPVPVPKIVTNESSAVKDANQLPEAVGHVQNAPPSVDECSTSTTTPEVRSQLADWFVRLIH